jgi:hypothetical protein
MKVRESITAVVGALGAALLAQYALYGIFMGAVPMLSGSAWFVAHVDTLRSTTLLLGFLATATAAGFALGKLIPGNPIPHVLAVGVASPLLGYALAGPIALARGWQIPMYAAQLCIIGMIAIRVHARRHRNHSGLHGAA